MVSTPETEATRRAFQRLDAAANLDQPVTLTPEEARLLAEGIRRLERAYRRG